MKTRKITNLIKGNPSPIGVTNNQVGIQFVIPCQGAKECKIKLWFHKEASEKYVILLDESFIVGQVFTVLVNKEWLGSHTSFLYIYEVNGIEVRDAYAHSLFGMQSFGGEGINKTPLANCLEYKWKCRSFEKADLQKTVLYQLHVRGFTKHKSSGVKHKGTFLGVIEKIRYLKELGVNGILLMPCYEFNEIAKAEEVFGRPQDIIESENLEGEKLNYWGYTPDSFYFAPKASFATSPFKCVEEFKYMVDCLHENEIAVYMDMYFSPIEKSNVVVDSLRYWVMEYHIDGFRVNQDAVSEEFVRNDIYLNDTNIIMNYWHTPSRAKKNRGQGVRIADCNDGFMIAVKKFLKGDEGQVQNYMNALIYKREYVEQFNYISDHNGFTLMDNCSYIKKHNEANGELNKDGTCYNYSENYGVEGKTKRLVVNQLRIKQVLNAWTLLCMSPNAIMIRAGDEFGNTQDGNNNPYCLDSNITWLNWNNIEKYRIIHEWVKTLLHNRVQVDFKEEVTFHGLQPWSVDLSDENATLAMLNESKGYYIAINLLKDKQRFELPFGSENKEWKVILSTDAVLNDERALEVLELPERTIAILQQRGC